MIGQIPARCRSATSFGCLRPDSVMEFGLNTQIVMPSAGDGGLHFDVDIVAFYQITNRP